MKIFLKKAWQYAIVAIWFLASLFFFEYILNRGNTDLTKAMSEASLPVICARLNGHDYNKMFGYTADMDYSLIRDGITPLEEGRSLNVRIYKKGENISSVKYELRSIDKERFVEEGEIKDYKESSEYIDAMFSFKDIISPETDYSLKIILTLSNGTEAYYYARVFIGSEDLNFAEKMDYVYYFNSCTFDKYTAQEEIGKYMESNSSGDNTDFSHVNIHSSMEQLTWGNLEVKKLDDPVCTVGEIDKKGAYLKLEYTLSASSGDEERKYMVSEYYRFVKGNERMYLLSFDRYMDTILYADKGVVYNDKLMLGIMPKNFEHAESEDGNTYAFVNNKALFVVNSAQNTFGTAYSYYDKDNDDDRCLNPDHDIKIVSIDESGNVIFYTYGYFNRGDHEGKCGIQLFEYISKTNVIEDKLFIECDKPYEIIKNDVETLAYANNLGEFYFYFDKKIFKVNLAEEDYEIVVEDLKKEDLYVCASYSMCAWVSKEDKIGVLQLKYLRMDTSESYYIDAKGGERIKALGFMGEDLIYGEAKNEDISVNVFGERIVPMYNLNIINKFKEILKKYSEENIYVTGCKINDNLITLSRNTKNENGEFVSAPPDSIVNTLMEKTYKNNSEVIATENLKKIVQVTLKREMDNKKIKFKTPKTAMYEGKREVKISTDSKDLFYVYGLNDCVGEYSYFSDAVKAADEAYGVVIDCDGHYTWKKETYATTNQIMKITDTTASDEETSSLERCIETILEYEGFSLDVKKNLTDGMTPVEIIEKNVPYSRGLELENCKSEEIKYFLNKDIPVIAMAGDNTVLIVGYSDKVYVWLNPRSGNLMKVNIDEAETFYENNGFHFITYIEWDS